MERARRLYEQGGDTQRLWEYVIHGHRWLHAGRQGLVTRKGEDPTLLHLHPHATRPPVTPPPVDDRWERPAGTGKERVYTDVKHPGLYSLAG